MLHLPAPSLFAIDGSATADSIEVVLVLLIAATALAILARRIGVPYPILLVLGGLALGFLPGLPTVELEPDVVFLLFLPPILFAAGYFTSIRALRAKAGKITSLAVGLVLFTAAAVAFVVHSLVPGIGWAPAFALGAIVAPPDAVAATAVFQRLGVPRPIVTTLEGESLLNDATALIVYRFAVLAAVSGVFSIVDAGAAFVAAAIGGLVIGIAVGAAVAWLVRRTDDPVFSTVITFVAPIAAYLPAEALDFSGVLSTVVAGIYLGQHSRALGSQVRVAATAAWQVLLFIVNGAVFILIGLQLPRVLANLGQRPAGELFGLAAAVVATVIVTRIAWVYVSIYGAWLIRARRRGDERPSVRRISLLAWAGMRGVVSLAAALALPALPDGSPFPERDLIVFLAFAVILATLVGQGLTLPPLIRTFELAETGGDGHEEAHARVITSEAAASRLEELADEWPGHLELIDTLRAQVQHRTRHAEQHDEVTESAEDTGAEQELLEHRTIRIAVIEAERTALVQLRERGAVSDQVFRRVERDLDLDELRLEA
jgi:CPA1 family monovalent cation:H+ antiporter